MQQILDKSYGFPKLNLSVPLGRAIHFPPSLLLELLLKSIYAQASQPHGLGYDGRILQQVLPVPLSVQCQCSGC